MNKYVKKTLLILVSFGLLFITACKKTTSSEPAIYAYKDSIEPITLYGREIKVEYSLDQYDDYVLKCENLLKTIDEEKESYDVIDTKIDEYYDLVRELRAEYRKSSLISDMTGKEEDYRFSNDVYDDFASIRSYDTKIELEIYNSKYKHDYYTDMTDEEIDEYVLSLSVDADEALNQAISKQNAVVTSYYTEELDAFEAAKKFIMCGNEIASLCNYDNYVEYSYVEEYDRDYSVEDTTNLKNYIKDYIVPLYDMTVSYLDDFEENATKEEQKIYQQYLNGCFAHYLDTIEAFANDLGGDYSTNFTYFINSGNYFLSAENDNTTAYQWSIAGEPYIFFGKDNQDIDTLVHEFGHYNANYLGSDDASYDLLETHSQGSEVLFFTYLYNNDFDCPEYLIYNMNIFLRTIIMGCLLNEFEMYLYNIDSIESMTKDEMKEYWDKLISDTGAEVFSSRHDFDGILGRLLDYPVYYISYSTSAVAAIELMSIAYNDYNQAKEIYKKIYANYEDNPEVDNFQQVIAYSGLSSVFEEEAF
nr:hypothetical protein [Gammaproteobacteria bacterium]